MRIVLLFIALTVAFSVINTNYKNGTITSANNDVEKTAIEKVVRDYIFVTDKKDQEAIKRAFHPSAKLMSVGKDGLREMSQEEWWGRVSRIPGKGVERKSKIAMVDVKGLAAVVRVDFDKSSDYISLLKINDEWKIVNKMLSTKL